MMMTVLKPKEKKVRFRWTEEEVQELRQLLINANGQSTVARSKLEGSEIAKRHTPQSIKQKIKETRKNLLQRKEIILAPKPNAFPSEPAAGSISALINATDKKDKKGDDSMSDDSMSSIETEDEDSNETYRRIFNKKRKHEETTDKDLKVDGFFYGERCITPYAIEDESKLVTIWPFPASNYYDAVYSIKNDTIYVNVKCFIPSPAALTQIATNHNLKKTPNFDHQQEIIVTGKYESKRRLSSTHVTDKSIPGYFVLAVDYPKSDIIIDHVGAVQNTPATTTR